MENAQEEASNYFKQKRDQYIIDIRKKKNTNQVEAKRIKFSVEFDQANPQNNPALNDKFDVPLEDLCAGFMNIYNAKEFHSLVEISFAIRLAISKSDTPPVGIVMNSGIAPILVDILNRPTFFDAFDVRIIKECSWIVVNLVSNDPVYTDYLVGLDIIPIANQLLEFKDQDVVENAVWILANITGDSLVYRDDLLKRNVAEKIEALFNDESLRSEIQNSLIWLISNLCRGPPYPKFEDVISFVLHLENYIKNSKNESVLAYCLYALSYLTNTDDEDQIEEILNMDVLDRIYDLFKTKNVRLQKAILRTIGNISSSSDEHLELLLDEGFLEAVYPFLDSPMSNIRREACWIYSNCLAGVTSQINKVFKFEDGVIIKKLFEMAREDTAEVSEECIFALCNASQAGMKEVGYLVDLGIIEMYLELLNKVKRDDILKDCLTALTTVLEEGKQIAFGPTPLENPYFNTLLECKGVEILERLQNHPNKVVYAKVENILKNFVDQMCNLFIY